jgi:23S rRNA pseudouridine2605 synthase
VHNKSARKIGLARVLSKLGYCSRSRAAELIRAGRVSLNGTVRRDPEAPVAETHDQIAVDGRVLEAAEKIYLMTNKPRGVVTTASDEQGRETIYRLLDARFSLQEPDKRQQSWIAPVGRLDKASEGLLLLTNDSNWAACITAPETHLDKTYHVQIAKVADEDFVRTMAIGIRMQDGEVLRAKRVRVLRTGQKNCWLEVVLDEGRNRQIRRMVESLGAKVLRLVRVAIGPLELGNLPKAKHRLLTAEEKRMLDQAMQRKML